MNNNNGIMNIKCLEESPWYLITQSMVSAMTGIAHLVHFFSSRGSYLVESGQLLGVGETCKKTL